MNHCSICKVQLDQPGMVETLDCGGDCIGCMAEAGDPDASRALREEIKKLRGALGAFLSENERLHADMQEIHTWLTNGDNSRLPHRVGCARSIAGAWLEDTPKTLNKEN